VFFFSSIAFWNSLSQETKPYTKKTQLVCEGKNPIKTVQTYGDGKLAGKPKLRSFIMFYT
jgi:hypothetical protein